VSDGVRVTKFRIHCHYFFGEIEYVHNLAEMRTGYFSSLSCQSVNLVVLKRDAMKL
jgi:hypothetical protein